MNRLLLPTAAASLLLFGSPAAADEIFVGVLAHDVETGLTKSGFEDGADIQVGWRGDRIRALSFIGSPSPHVFGSLSTAGDTHFAAAGISWRIGDRFFVRPGVGLAIHDGPGSVVPGDERIDFGSRILFAPEIGVGYRVTDRASIEASWVHLSHAQLFGRQNPGMDSIGVRLTYDLP